MSASPDDQAAHEFDALLTEIRACRVCTDLPLGPQPIVHASPDAPILLVGQAPGTKVHATGLSFNDPSGDLLRTWLDVDRPTFYDTHKFALLPTGLCYPGRGKSGDAPPRPNCAPLWHPRLRPMLPKVQLTILIGQYAQAYYLGDRCRKTLAATAASWREYTPEFWPIPHPSPRNRRWLRLNPWFEDEVVPLLRARVHALLGSP